MSIPSHPDPIDLRCNTALAFLLAPGIAALTGGLAVSVVSLSAQRIDWNLVLLGPFVFAFFFALVGYPTAAIVGVPVYLVLPERARRAFAVVVPLAGAIAAAPWLLLVQPWRPRTTDGAFLLVPFALGCVAGIAFLFIRRPRCLAGRPVAFEESPPALSALSCEP